MTRSLVLLVLAAAACNPPPTQAEYDLTRGAPVQVFFNDPGTRPNNMWSPDAIPVLVNLIDSTRATLDFAAMDFNRQEVIDAVIRAYDRGVKVRFVGDAGYTGASGYVQLDNRQIPMVVGNYPSIMHNKFFVMDGRFVWAETANVSDDDMTHNWNNFVFIDSPPVAQDFTTEFDQMWDGRFGATKTEVGNGKIFQVGDTSVEVWFTPDEDALGRIIEVVNGAQEGIRFTIFAFTKDQLGSAYIHKQEQFEKYNSQHGLDMTSSDLDSFHTVAGVIDQSQLHSNGQYHEAYRLLGAAVPLRLDGNDNSDQPGDYQAGGGRLHSKTMIIDPNTDDPSVITGSFNWSSSATLSNDEFLLVMKSPRIATQYMDYFDHVWGNGRHIGNAHIGQDGLQAGDVVINEVMWDGLHPDDPEGTDEFIELRNRTDKRIDLSMWQIVNGKDFVVGLPPGSVIGPNDTFLILDHTLEPYQDGTPQDNHGAYLAGDLVVNTFNDDRMSRLYLKDGQMRLILQDPNAVVMDVAGDGGPPFAGGPDGGGVVHSMERREDNPGNGADPASWYSCTSSGNDPIINPAYAAYVMATPDRPNSPPP